MLDLSPHLQQPTKLHQASLIPVQHKLLTMTCAELQLQKTFVMLQALEDLWTA